MTDYNDSGRYPELTAHLGRIFPQGTRPALCTSVLPSLVHCISAIASTLQASHHVSLVGTANAFGDEQLNVDVSAERIIREEIAKCPSILTASSEEDPKERPAHGSRSVADSEGSEQYTLAFDPLDGSSIIAPNWTVGTIIGIWDGSSALHQLPHRKQIAAVLGIYGPRTTAVVALNLPDMKRTCFEIGLAEATGKITCTVLRPEVEFLKPPFKTRYFAPANLRAAAEDEGFLNLINHYVKEKYTLRYSGGLVADVYHAMVKGHGVYISPVTTKSKAKLRRLYELTPIALIMECAGGSALDPIDGTSVLGKPIEDCDERAGLLCGTTEEVTFVTQSFGL